MRRARAAVPLVVAGAALAAALLTASGHARTRRRPGAPPPGAHIVRVAARSPASPRGHRSSAGTQRTSLDAVLHAMRVRVRAPAATAAIVRCGRVVWAGADGVIDLQSRRRATNHSLFVLNSAAKTIVAAMIMQEVEAGQLALDTKLSDFYPWLPNASSISVRMLLDMRSGLPNYLGTARIHWTIQHDPRHRWTVEQVLTGLGAGLGTPEFRPGHGYQYSDTNYILLGAILERITHSSIERDFQRLIGRPLGISSATFVPTPAAEARVAHPYRLRRDGALISQWIPGYGVPSAVWGPVFTDGGMAGTSVDLAKFANALLGDRLVSPAAVAQMTHLGLGHYGFAFRGRSFDGHYWWGHYGGFGGFEAEDWSDPSRQLTFAVATNAQEAKSEPISNRIWRALVLAYDRQNHGILGCR